MSGLQPPLEQDRGTGEDAARRLASYMYAHIPLVAQMQVTVTSSDAQGLRLTAPLAPNINHERTAFGGSLASIMTLACWGYLWLQLEGEPRLHIVVNEAKVSYLKPVTGALDTLCLPPPPAELERFREMLARRGKARIELAAEVRQGDTLAARYLGSFAVYRET
ncbi:MAG TPA: YiiD C-terminal domain-containing protein [Gammaproteobacteria bacterium]|nr:YiiD C-terminal domain-containing protein [Gammaproteobacteria bacterium]